MIANRTGPQPGRRPAAVVVAAMLAAGGFLPMTHAQQPDGWIDGRTLRYGDVEYRCIDDEGVFFIETDSAPAVPLPGSDTDLRDLWGTRVPDPVRVRLVDTIDATLADHAFNETPWIPDQHDNAPSRILNIGGNAYRVTAAATGFDLYWFSYEFATDPHAGVPHLMVVESANDRERYNGIGITALETWTDPHPADGGAHWEPAEWSPPYDDGSGRCIAKTQEGDWGIVRDVGVSVYSGREIAADGQPYQFGLLFYPKGRTNRVTVSCSGWAQPPHPDDGAAVRRIWVFAIDDPVAARAADPAVPVDGPERRIGIYMTHPWYLYGHYGTPSCTRDQRRVSLAAALDQLRFCGMNWLEFNAINGSDRSSIAWYSGSDHFPMLQGDLFDEMIDLAEARDVGLLPVITSILPPPGDPGKWGFSPSASYQVESDGTTVRTAFGSWAPDPLRPEVQDFLIDLVDEIGARAAHSPAVRGIGFRVNGKIGLCYIASQDGNRGASTSGYSQWDLEQFRADTGIDVPTTPGDAYPWLQSRPDAWESWIDWRCRRTREFWLRVRDAVRSHRSDLELHVKCVLPSEIPGTNIEWPGTSPRELLRHHGLDPLLFAGDDGIVIHRTMMIAEDRFFDKWGPPWGANAERYRDFHYAPGLAPLYTTPAGAAVELYHNYWEEAFHPDVEFGGFDNGFRTHTPAALGRHFYEAALYSLAEATPDYLTFMGWERATLAHETDLRRFASAVRALPDAPPQPFDGRIARGNAVVRWYDDRIAVLNTNNAPVVVELELASPVPPDTPVLEAATGRVLLPADAPERDRVTVRLDAFDLAVLAFTGAAPPEPGFIGLLNPGFEDDGASRVFPPRSWQGWGDDNPDGTLNGDEFGLAGTLFRPRSGDWCAGKYTDWGTTAGAGMQQTVDTVPGHTYLCEAWGFTPATDHPSPPGELRLGIDPFGGADRTADRVLWAPWSSYFDAWTRFGFLEDDLVTARADRITLFLEYRQPTPRPSNAMVFDDVAIRPWPPAHAVLATY